MNILLHCLLKKRRQAVHCNVCSAIVALFQLLQFSLLWIIVVKLCVQSNRTLLHLGSDRDRGCFLIYVCSFNVFAAKWTLYCLGSGWWCIMMKSWWSLEEWLRPRHLILRLITPINWSPLLWFYSAGQLRHMFDKIGEISGFSSKTNISEGHLWKCLFW